MTNLKNIFKNIFIYKEPRKEHDFILLESSVSKNILSDAKDNSSKKEEQIPEKSPIYNSLKKNIEFIKVKYNSLINSDIVLREFNISVKGKNYRSLLIAIDGMVSSELINNYILKPLMIERTRMCENEQY